MGKPDISSKKVIDMYGKAWAEWLLQQESIEIEAQLSGEFQFIARATDSLLQIKSKDETFLALTELQFVYDDEMPARLRAYAALAHHKYKLKVYVTVIFFLRPPEGVTIPDKFYQAFRGQVSQQDFKTVCLWEMDAEQVLAFDIPALLPFVPLMQGGNKVEVVRKCAERIRKEPNSEELEAILATFASYVMDVELVKQLLRWEMQIVQESPLIKELVEQKREVWIAQGVKQGVKQGIKQGEHKAKVESLNEIITSRFKTKAKKFEEQLSKLDLKSLKKLTKIALKVKALTEFEEELTKMLPKPKKNGKNGNNGDLVQSDKSKLS